jgi:hypothetical protein
VDVYGKIFTIAGKGVSGFWDDGAAATNGDMNKPRQIAVDAAGNISRPPNCQ